MYKRILIPTDGSTLSRKAAKAGVRFAKEQKAKVVGFYVGPPYRPNVFEEHTTRSFISPQSHAAKVKQVAEGYLDVIRKAAAEAGVPCDCHHASSDYPYDEIVKAAQRHKCDLIFMASHGRRGISRLLLGSETSKVLSHSKIPVLVNR